MIKEAQDYFNAYVSILSANDAWLKADSKNDFSSTLADLQSVKAAGLEARKQRLAMNKELINAARAKKEDVNQVKLLEPNETEKDYEAKNDKYNFALRQGYLMVNGYYLKVNEEIEGKIIQALGTRTFTSLFRLEVPHDAYSIQEYGIGAVVIDELNYESSRYLVCNVLGNIIYVKTEEKIAKGTEIKLGIDLSKARLFESRFDIRLY